ncbi:MAG: DUF4272 domain-containing protein [Roseovarius sp.]
MLRFLTIAAMLVCMTGPAHTQSQNDIDRKAMIESMDDTATEGQLARKARSIKTLQSMGVPVLDTLPVIAGLPDAKRRSSTEVANRALALMIVALKGETLDQDLVNAVIGQYDAQALFTPRELAFITARQVDDQTRADMTWRYESVAVLLWALGFLDELPPPDTIIDASVLGNIFSELGPDGLRGQARLRPQTQILDAADLAYRMNWAAVDARVSNEATPKGLHPGITYERHYALNWLYGYADLPWDDMRTDT